ncbi:TRAP transporter permease [Ureibacillus chungkukjangi]|uniref:TRAP transporter 4TM/12TM fusion protein n=1 Tax=Ureibacillus chungkukjangi TaxID=1202712 RepID=A0A318U242_9BACL|nr:TRAP transporter permease [Ureibacillus chungkukjangi]PYF08455.1 TRAP transporter 4TM/12TM fusion protein [Ureibacillus chungkukjangi]
MTTKNSVDVDVQGLVEIEEKTLNSRKYIGIFGKVVVLLAIIWTVFQLYMSSIGVMDAVKFRAWHLGFLLLFSFIFYPATKKSVGTRKLPTILDILCIGLSAFVIFYFLFTYDTFVRERAGENTTMDIYVGSLALLLLFEASRRVVGIGLTLIALFFLTYNFFGAYIPGLLGHYGFSIERVVNLMYWGGQGVFGTALGVSATYIFVFVLFGAFLKNSGFSDFINDLALTIAGRTAGGPAKVAVFASALMATVSGSAVSNVVTTGTVTIPMMKKAGYSKKFAGAVESVASTGGLIAPPVMGAAAFIMAEYLGVSYSVVLLAAIIPAILYYLTLFMIVHFEAKKMGLSGIAKENIPNAKKVLKDGGHLFIPLIILLIMLFSGFSPIYAAIISLITVVPAAAIRKNTRMSLTVVIESIVEGVKGAISVGIACAVVGIVIATITLTSVGLLIGNNVLSFAGESILLAAVLTAFISIVLGMGVPATAAYIIVATISVPILTKLGVAPVAAHMFAFYFAALSSITPPVALAAYAAAGIAGESPNKVAFESVRLGLIGFIVPFFFIFNPTLLLTGGTIGEYIYAGVTAIIGGIALAAGLKGYLFRKTYLVERILLLIAGISLMDTTLLVNIISLIVVGLVVASQALIRDKAIAAEVKVSEMEVSAIEEEREKETALVKD